MERHLRRARDEKPAQDHHRRRHTSHEGSSLLVPQNPGPHPGPGARSAPDRLGRSALPGILCREAIAADLGDPGAPAAIERAVRERGLTIDYIVNNAGFGTTGAFVDAALDRELEQIRVNVSALVELTHRFGKGLRERRRGGILNVASTAGFQPGPGMLRVSPRSIVRRLVAWLNGT
ncbi:MAG TPA: SDR family NAD(P)-dependent oxidoreductase [Polyangiaceae bacterium]|nr:SDR family NAD(P)-dependent oxidoreductase [Polyangiaceae bacterium]